MSQPRSQTFATPSPGRLRIEIPRGHIEVAAGETGETTVTLTARHDDPEAWAWIEDARIEEVAGEIVVRGKRLGAGWFGLGCGPIDAVVTAPLASDAHLSTGAGKIETSGRLGKVTAQSGAGAIALDACAEAHARTGSGAIAIAEVAGSVDAKSGAGRVAIGKVGADARITTGSGSAELAEVAGQAHLTTGAGNVEIGRAGDGVEIFCASGSVHVRRADHGRVRAKTVSGGVSVGVAEGVAALLDVSTMSGRVRSELASCEAPREGEKHVELILSTVSGNVSVARA